jgi:hypothetical protein
MSCALPVLGPELRFTGCSQVDPYADRQERERQYEAGFKGVCCRKRRRSRDHRGNVCRADVSREENVGANESEQERQSNGERDKDTGHDDGPVLARRPSANGEPQASYQEGHEQRGDQLHRGLRSNEELRGDLGQTSYQRRSGDPTWILPLMNGKRRERRSHRRNGHECEDGSPGRSVLACPR